MSITLSSLEKIAAVLRKQRGPAVRTVLRLEDTFRVREPIEDAGGFSSELYESSSRLLVARRVRQEKALPAVGLDSTSRKLETAPADVVIGSVASFCARAGIGYEWPSLGGPSPPLPPHPAYSLLPNGELEEIDDPVISTRNPAGEKYDVNYSADAAEEELRSSLESWMMSSLAFKGCAVLLDGPLYHLPRALLESSVPEKIRRSFLALLSKRLRALEALEAQGVPVVGVVKRVEKSSILRSTPGLEQWVGEKEGDLSAIARAFLSAEKEPGRVYATPKVIVSSAAEGAPSKLIQYVVMPPGKYQQDSSLARIYRLEFTSRTLKILEEMKSDPLSVLVGDSLLLGSQEPVSIRASDRRAAEIAEALMRGLSSAIEGGTVLAYWSVREVEVGWRRGGER
ncbi:MAG: DNA double-strand break repair nuclease NurA [Acidilobaceae archaeon]|nr:DNA double-strand break repair nuclease NurA [Acidilobaceae archaeon]